MRAPLADTAVVIIVTSRGREVLPQDLAPECERFALSAFLFEPHRTSGIHLSLPKCYIGGRSLFGRHLIGDRRTIARRVRPLLVDAVERGREEAAYFTRVTRERAVDKTMGHHFDKERWLDGLSCLTVPRLQHLDEGNPLAGEGLVLSCRLRGVDIWIALDPSAWVAVGDLEAVAQGDGGDSVDRQNLSVLADGSIPLVECDGDAT